MPMLFFLLLSCRMTPIGESSIGEVELPVLPPRQEVVLPPAEAPTPARDIRIALIGEVRGEVEPCGCPTLPYGGFVRRERLLEELRAEPSPLFQLDAGDTLMKGFSSTRDALGVRAEAVLRMSAAVGVDAWAPGPSDIQAVGTRGILAAPIPAISATWAGEDGRLFLPPAIVLERDGIRLGVIGLSAVPSSMADQEAIYPVDPVDAARSAAAGLPDDLDLIVALSSLSAMDAERVAQNVPAIAAILSTQGGSYEDPYVVDGGPALVEVPDRGRYLSLVHVRLGAGPSADLRLLPTAQRWRERLTLQQQHRQLGTPALAAELASVEDAFAELGAGRNLMYLDVLPLSEVYDGRASVGADLEQFLSSLVDEAAAVAEQEPTALEPGYASSGSCSNCHLQEFARWAYTDHAQAAWMSLVERDATENPECVSCHSTGFGEVGGFGELTPSNLRKFKAVQCEACHGPMRGHNGNGNVQPRPISAASCLGCHDVANSPDFDFASYLQRASCQPAATP